MTEGQEEERAIGGTFGGFDIIKYLSDMYVPCNWQSLAWDGLQYKYHAEIFLLIALFNNLCC